MSEGIDIKSALTAFQLKGIGRKKAFKIANDYLAAKSIPFNTFLERHELVIKSNNSFQQIDSAEQKALKLIEESKSHGISIISFYDKKYPEILKSTDDPPFLLNYKGNINLLNEKSGVAIIGTRNPSKYGFDVSKRFATRSTEKGLNVVSGLALGCDEAAHIGALESNGYTTAVLAHGLDITYPKENKELAQNILNNKGLLISEYFVGQKGMRNYFVERDRIQAGLSKGIIVVETDIKGGTMHTVGFAKNYGRLIATFQHPKKKLEGNIMARGNQMLIKENTALPLSDEKSLNSFFEQILTNKETIKPNPQKDLFE